jgi:hypothetical protein
MSQICSAILFLIYFFLIRFFGLFVTMYKAFKDDKEAGSALSVDEQSAVKASIFWEDILCPFLDTDSPQERAQAITTLQKSGLKMWQIQLLRAAVGVGFIMVLMDEWMVYTYEDLIWRWCTALLLDVLVTGLILLLSFEMGMALGIIWILELAIFLILILFNYLKVKGAKKWGNL